MGILYFPQHLMEVARLYRRGYFLVETVNKSAGDLYAMMFLKSMFPQQWGDVDEAVLREGREWMFDFVPYIPEECGQDAMVVARTLKEYDLVIRYARPKLVLDGSRASGLVAMVQPSDDRDHIIAGMLSTAFRAGSVLPQNVKDMMRAE